MDSKMLQTISQEIYRRFPDLNGRSPRVQPYRLTNARLMGSHSPQRRSSRPEAYVLIYQGRKVTSTGKAAPYLVRVLVDDGGKILKITMSR